MFSRPSTPARMWVLCFLPPCRLLSFGEDGPFMGSKLQPGRSRSSVSDSRVVSAQVISGQDEHVIGSH